MHVQVAEYYMAPLRQALRCYVESLRVLPEFYINLFAQRCCPLQLSSFLNKTHQPWDPGPLITMWGYTKRDARHTNETATCYKPSVRDPTERKIQNLKTVALKDTRKRNVL